MKFTCPYCASNGAHRVREMEATFAAWIYTKLKDKLHVVSSWGCYVPARGSKKSIHSEWPLHYWEGPGNFPLVVEFGNGTGKNPTFKQFCLVYGIIPKEFK